MKNPLLLSIDNISSNVDVLSDLINKPQPKPVLFVIKADWCGYCRRFTENAWNTFKKMNTAATHLQIVEIDDKALGWLRDNNQKQLHTSLLVEPPSVYFPQVYMLVNKKKHGFQPDYSEVEKGKPSVALAVLNKWVDSFISLRKSVGTHSRRVKKAIGGKPNKQLQSKPRTTPKKRVSTQTKKSLNEEIDAAFRKLLLH